MKTITLTVTDDATIMVDGVEYVPTKPERELWTPEDSNVIANLDTEGDISEHRFCGVWQPELVAGNTFPTREHAAAAELLREVEAARAVIAEIGGLGCEDANTNNSNAPCPKAVARKFWCGSCIAKAALEGESR